MVKKKKYKVTTRLGKREFDTTFETPLYVDKYLKGAMKLRKKYPGVSKPIFFVNGTRVTKKY